MLKFHDMPNAMKKITPGANPLSPRPHHIYVGKSGTVDIENEDGTAVTGIGVVAGSTILCRFHAITKASATLFGIYP